MATAFYRIDLLFFFSGERISTPFFFFPFLRSQTLVVPAEETVFFFFSLEVDETSLPPLQVSRAPSVDRNFPPPFSFPFREKPAFFPMTDGRT